MKAAISLAHNLKHKYGIRQGDRVILFMDHHHYMLPTWFGCALAGAILCPFAFTHEVVKEEIGALISQVNPSMLIASEGLNLELFKEIFIDLKLNIPTLTYNNDVKENDDLKPLLEDTISIDDFSLPVVKNSNTETFVLALSSSTTGKTKLINISHRQMLMFM